MRTVGTTQTLHRLYDRHVLEAVDLRERREGA